MKSSDPATPIQNFEYSPAGFFFSSAAAQTPSLHRPLLHSELSPHAAPSAPSAGVSLLESPVHGFGGLAPGTPRAEPEILFRIGTPNVCVGRPAVAATSPPSPN